MTLSFSQTICLSNFSYKRWSRLHQRFPNSHVDRKRGQWNIWTYSCKPTASTGRQNRQTAETCGLKLFNARFARGTDDTGRLIFLEVLSNDEGIHIFFFNTPIFHHSKTDICKSFWQLLIYPFIGHNLDFLWVMLIELSWSDQKKFSLRLEWVKRTGSEQWINWGKNE